VTSVVTDRPAEAELPDAAPAPERAQSRLRRALLAAGPILAVYVAACAVYGFQAWHHEVPWLFQDELFYAQQAQSLADTGEITIRGQPEGEDPLSTIVGSLAWRITDDSGTGYLLAKLLNVLLMSAACFPAYALARLVVGRPAALFAAAGTVAIPAFVYASMILTEPLAYLLSTTAIWLVTRTLASEHVTRSTLLWGASAVGVTWLATQARLQLQVLFLAFVLAGGVRILLARRVRERLWLVLPGAALLAGGIYLVYRWRLQGDSNVIAAEDNWDIFKLQATWAFGALAIGIAVVPAVLGLAALWPTGERRHSSAHIAFSLVGSSAVAGLVYYTAVKGTFLWLTFAWRVIERNLIYAAPVLFVAVAIVLQYRRLNPLALAGALGLVAWCVYEVPYQLAFRIYADAPGLAVLSTANRHFQWTDDSVRKYLAVMLAVSALVALGLYLIRDRRAARYVATALGVLVVGGALTAEVAADRSSRGASTMFAENLPKPYDWVHEATGGARSLLVGTAIADPNGIWLTQFFNPNLWYLASLDSTAPPPGPNTTPRVVDATGRLDPQFDDAAYAVVDNKAEIAGEVLRRTTYQTLYAIDRPLRLTKASYGVMGDGWMSDRAVFYQFFSPEPGPGAVRVTASRAAWGGPDAPGEVTIRVSTLAPDAESDPATGEFPTDEVLAEESFTIHSRQIVQYLIPTPGPPFEVEITVDPTFSPVDYGGGDVRKLGVQPEVEYLPGIELNRVLERELNPPDPALQQGE
jgi:hypothetical protein